MSKIKIIIMGICIVAIACGIVFISRDKGAQYETVKAVRKDIREEVAATGSVKPATTVNLQFENTGTVARIAVKVGDMVKTGAALAELDTKDLAARVLQDEAAVAQATAKLALAREGTRSEDLAVTRTALANAETAAADAKSYLDAVNAKADNDLADAYEDGRVAFINNLVTFGNIREDVRAIYLSPPSKFSESDPQAKNSFNNEYLITDAAYAAARAHFTGMSANPSRDGITTALSDIISAASQMSRMLDLTNRALAATDSVPAATKTTIATDITTMKTLLTAITDAKSALSNVAAANTVTVQSAASAYNAAAAKAESAKKDLTLKEAGSRPSELAQLEAALAEARARLAVSRVTLKKSQLVSPIDGVVTALPVEIGEIARAGVVAASLMTQDGYEIDVQVPEADIPKVAVGANAEVTLDAFGPDKKFAASVAKIDPAETKVEGVVYYAITVVFAKGENAMRPGMTANVTIVGREAKNVLVIPQRAVETRNGGKIVRVLVNGAPQDREVALGIRSARGDIEITSGLAEEERVIVFEKKK